MALIRNSSGYPVKLVSYQEGKTKFGKDDEVIYPGECRYVNANNFDWDTALITAFTEDANPPGGVKVTGGSGVIGTPWATVGVGVSVQLETSEAIAAMTIEKHSFAEFYSDNGKPAFKLTNGEGGCRVNHGW